MTVADCTGGALAGFTAPARADHSRFVQRVRRRYEAQLDRLPDGAPTRELQQQTLDGLLAQGLDLACASW
jgi:[glutamine synthetase] adenylyltransferase / [glutamine synthetase]-adenylyl-L-tyrosine phosphorylase